MENYMEMERILWSNALDIQEAKQNLLRLHEEFPEYGNPIEDSAIKKEAERLTEIHLKEMVKDLSNVKLEEIYLFGNVWDELGAYPIVPRKLNSTNLGDAILEATRIWRDKNRLVVYYTPEGDVLINQWGLDTPSHSARMKFLVKDINGYHSLGWIPKSVYEER